MDYATVLTHPIQFDLMPWEFTIPIRLSPHYVRGYAHRALAARQLEQEEQARADEDAVRELEKQSGEAG